ncbi:MAG: CSLREA domain-containing protein [Chloroflexi bacterium]|nr:MAG: CSLREA domain-containing protein [Chloroflexota bacterium]MBL1194475.1 CSLREA domain-containing protein [Chloroflexota bacterium]NOH11763.1 CSLREA domain-containing protein [Chloroflexota bacterium]
MNRPLRLSLKLTIVLVLVLTVSAYAPAYAAPPAIVVNSLEDELNYDGKCNLREAIRSANNVSQPWPGCTQGQVGGNSITFSVSGDIKLTDTLPTITRNLEIKAYGQDVRISGQKQFRVMTVSTSITLAIGNLTISDGFTTGDGGGIFVSAGTLKVADSTFFNNVAEGDGGAIHTVGGQFWITDSTFYDNTADGQGGGISVGPSPFVTSKIEDSTFSDNHAHDDGGGMAILSGVIRMTNNTLAGNTAADLGGGIYNLGVLKSANNTFSNNRASDRGGGIWNLDALTIKSSTFSGNYAGNSGGGIYNHGNGVLRLMNTILANSPSGYDCFNSFGTIAVDIHNLIESSPTSNSCGSPMLTADPMLGPLADNGGPTMTHAIQPGSLALDAGHNGRCASNLVSNKDQRGEVRPIDGDGDQVATCDIGAFEYQGP